MPGDRRLRGATDSQIQRGRRAISDLFQTTLDSPEWEGSR